jgi:hypothetical protein
VRYDIAPDKAAFLGVMRLPTNHRVEDNDHFASDVHSIESQASTADYDIDRDKEAFPGIIGRERKRIDVFTKRRKEPIVDIFDGMCIYV